MNQLLSYSIFFIYFLLTKEEITYKFDDNYNNNCLDIKENGVISQKINDLASLDKSEYGLNAQSCRLNEQARKIDDGTKCCYASIFQKSKWYYICTKIPKEEVDSVPEYIKTLNDDQELDGVFDEIKIDCFSKKFDVMIITLIISLIYLF